MNVRKTKTVIQLHPAITDVKGPTNSICYWRTFVIANKRDDLKGLELSIHYQRISITLGSGIAGFNCRSSIKALAATNDVQTVVDETGNAPVSGEIVSVNDVVRTRGKESR